LGLIIAVVLVAAYFEFSKSRDSRTARSVSAAYVEAGEKASKGDIDEAVRHFVAIADKSPSGYSGLSYMQAASLKLDQNQPLERAFEKPRHADLAQLKAAYVLTGQGRYDDAALRLAPLAEKDAPYEYLSRELLALALKETGDIDGAKKEYSYLENIPGVPASIQERAKQAMTLIRVAEDTAAPVETKTELATTPDTDISPETGEETESE